MNGKPIFSYSQSEESTGYLLWQVTMGWHLRMNWHRRPVGLTLTQFSLLAGLFWLSRQGKTVTQQRLADYVLKPGDARKGQRLLNVPAPV